MNGIIPTQPPNRSGPGPDAGTGKVAASTAARDESPAQQNSAQQNSARQGQGQKTGDSGTGHRGHADPAISLSASLARLGLGATLKGTVAGFDANQQPVIKTPQGTFVLNVDDLKAALKLAQNSQVELKISAIDHVIEAQLIARDGVRIDPPLRVKLALVGLAPDAAKLAAKTTPEIPDRTYTMPVSTPLKATGPNVSAEDSTAFATIRNSGPAVPASAGPAENHENQASPVLARTPDPARSARILPNINLLHAADQLSAQQADTKMVRSAPSSPAQSSLVPGNEVPALLNAVPAGPVGSTSLSATPLPVTVRLRIISIQPPGIDSKADTIGPDAPGQPSARPAAGTSNPEQPEQFRLKAEVTGPTVLRSAGSTPFAAAATLISAPPAPEVPELLLHTDAGIIRLAVTKADIAALPHGTKLDIVMTRRPVSGIGELATARPQTLPSSPAAPVSSMGPSPETQPLASYMDQWSTIDKILAVTQAIDPTLAGLVMDRIAAPTHQMGTKTVFLLSLLGLNQSAEKWLGSKVTETLKQAGRHDLIARLGDDFHRIASLGRDNNSNDWRPVLLPFHDGRETQALPILIRQFRDPSADQGTSGKNNSDQEGGNNATRFVIDLNLSRLGSLQMDGMIKSRRFNLIMRSEQPLETGIRTEISRIFSSALNRNRFDGEVVFRPGTPFPLSAAAFMNDTAAGKFQGDFYA